MGIQGLWMGLDIWALSFLGLLAAATAAALLGMRRIQVTPLGVRTLQSPAGVHWVRVVLAVLGVIAAQVLARLSGFGSVAMAVTVSLIAVAVPLVVVQLVGPWVLKVVTRRQLKKARSVERLIAARSVLESPQQMWKQIGGVSITTYVGVIAGCGLGIITAGDGGVSTQEQTLMADVQRGVWLTLAVAFLMAACSVGVNQTAQVLDRKHLYSSLAKMGMEVQQLQRIRTLSVMRSLGIVVTIALITAAVTAFPIIGIAVVTAPATVVTALVVLGLGMLAVYTGAQVTFAHYAPGRLRPLVTTDGLPVARGPESSSVVIPRGEGCLSEWRTRRRKLPQKVRMRGNGRTPGPGARPPGGPYLRPPTPLTTGPDNQWR